MTKISSHDDDPKGRVEDRRLLTGRGRFVDDIKLEGQAYMGLVRSPYAHARITSIDFSDARSSPEFIASLTGEDLVKEGMLPVSQNPWPFQKKSKRFHLAVGKVRFAGEPVAAILVKDLNSVEDLIERVRVQYDPLPVVTTIEESKKGKALVFEEWGSNLSLTSEIKKGDVKKALDSAAHVIHAREGIARQVAAPIEPRAVLAAYDKKQDNYEVWTTVQSVHGAQEKLASELRLPKEKFHVRVMDVGGGFGSKGAQSYPEAPLACIFSRRTGLPVKWTATRIEEFLEAAAGRDEYCDITLACDKDGRFVALRASVECDSGVGGTQVHMPSMTIETMLGPYRIPNQELTVAAYLTNKMPLGPVRGAGGPEGCYFIERAVDVMAKKMGLDPIELRRRNVTRPAPKGRAVAHEASAENYSHLLDELVKSSHYAELLQWRGDLLSKFRHEDPSRSRLVGGLGVSITGSDDSEEEEEEWSGEASGGEGGEGDESGQWKGADDSGEERRWTGAAEETLGFMSETARVVLDKNGHVTVFTGSSPHGQGEETTFAQLASEEIGFPLEKVTVVWGDTLLIPRGVGTYGSRSAATGGSAVVDASRKLKAELLAAASRLAGAEEASLDIRDGVVVDKSRPRAKLPSIRDVLEAQHKEEITASSVFTLPSSSYSSGVQLCALTLNVESGRVKIVKYVVVEDCGRMINKAIVEGQLEGGVIHGVGGALSEKLVYDAGGNLLSSTFMDYNIPTTMDSPNVEVFHVVTPSEVTLDGVKGVGESGTNAAYAAVLNALNDALAQVGSGAELNMAPATPEAIFSVLGKSGFEVRRSS